MTDDSELSGALERLAKSTDQQTAQIRELTSAIMLSKLWQKVAIALVIMVAIGVTGVGVLIYNQSQDSADRARIATQQRDTQLEILRRLEAQR